MNAEQRALSQFHPLIARWFSAQVGEPTDVQEKAWPRLAKGEHLLITAPTGSGKTLAAFLSAIDQLVTGELPTGRTSVLYVSPLKALNNDVRRNLLVPLYQIRQVFEGAGETFPDIRVLTRSGDTPQHERRRMQRRPPEILITTPESLNLLLSSMGGRSVLKNIAIIIVDEIHSVIGGKRGVHLITAVERLARLSGEFQRIALSATIRPPETAAEFVGGYVATGDARDPDYAARSVGVVRSGMAKRYDIRVHLPKDTGQQKSRDSFWQPFVEELRTIIAKNQSTLVFTNSRRLCERLTLLLNAHADRPIAYAHHGSLSREIRETVERKFKAGELKAIVATSSLEMGIDIGALDEVVIIQSPPSISSAIQRIGRACHQVGAASRGTLFPTHSRDLLDAAVLAEGILDHDIKGVQPVQCPLDVLAQVIVSMTAMEKWDIDELYSQLRTSYPYRDLRRNVFDRVLEMLAGRYGEGRIRELKPRVSIDRLDSTVAAKKGAIQAVYTSGGTIPDRGYYQLRHHKTHARIGELDEEFVWENGEGSSFTLGTQHWRVERVTHNDVFVLPAGPGVQGPPFWRAEENSRDFHFSARIGRFLQAANDRLDDPEFSAHIQKVSRMDEASADKLIAFLKKQKIATGCDLPHRRHILIELAKAGPEGAPGDQVLIHTFWGGKVNRPFAMALQAAWQDRFGYQLEVSSTDDCVVLLLADEAPGEELLSLVSRSTVRPLLRQQLEASGFFGARFRECAGRSLLLTRTNMSQRMPLWVNRLRSQKLLDAVMGYPDFPILLETWRTCLQDELDLESLEQVLSEIESGATTWTEVRTEQPSPFAQSISWWQINQYMYMDDQPKSAKTSMLRGDLLSDVVFNPGLRPTVAPEIVQQFESKRQRLSPGYSPQTARDLIDWVKERLLMPASEWEALLDAMRRDHGIEPDAFLGPIADKLARLSPPEASEPLIVALEMLPRVSHGLYAMTTDELVMPLIGPEPVKCEQYPGAGRDEILTSLLGEWLQFYGPRTAAFIQSTLGIEAERLKFALEDLRDGQKVIMGELVTGSREDEVCDSENFGSLLRLARADARPTFEPLDIEWLPLFLAHFHGLTGPQDDGDGLSRCIEQLVCHAAPAELWESDILPARVRGYSASKLDSLMLEGELLWVGCEKRQISFCFAEDLDLMRMEGDVVSRHLTDSPKDEGDQGHDSTSANRGGENANRESPSPACAGTADRASAGLSALFGDADGRYDFFSLLRLSKSSAAALADQLWDAAWRGQVTNDTFVALRRGIETKFKMSGVAGGNADAPRRRLSAANAQAGRLGRHAAFARWKGSAPTAGAWRRLPIPELTDDLLEVEERNRARVRSLLDRYGVLFRELLQRELPPFRWSRLFRTLRLMELSGEVMAGCFFHGIPGLQFISRRAFHILRRGLPADAVFWINAADPISMCGIQLDAMRGSLPKRLTSTHLVYKSSRMVMVSERNGKALTFNVPQDDPHLQEYLCALRHLLEREFHPLRRIVVETINGEEAAGCAYLAVLREVFDVALDYNRVILRRRAD